LAPRVPPEQNPIFGGFAPPAPRVRFRGVPPKPNFSPLAVPGPSAIGVRD
jgi:hypothetical protein